jgi:hypothetical protein
LRNGEVDRIEDLLPLCIEAEFLAADGKEKIKPYLIGIDSGYRTADIYDICREIGPHLRPTKGEEHWRAPWTSSKIDINPRDGKPYPFGSLLLWHLDVGHWKAWIQHRWTLGKGQPGSWNLHSEVTEDYLRQITAEVQVKKRNKRGQEVYEWIIRDTAAGNHYFDCEVAAAAMADMLKADMGRTKSGQALPSAPTPTKKREGFVQGKLPARRKGFVWEGRRDE